MRWLQSIKFSFKVQIHLNLLILNHSLHHFRFLLPLGLIVHDLICLLMEKFLQVYKLNYHFRNIQ